MLEESSPVRWRPATRVAFRFFFSYFALFLIPSRILGWLPFGNWLAEMYTMLWHHVVLWIGHSIVHTTYDISLPEGAVSNSAHATIELGCYLVVAALATLVWSILDRKRLSYTRLHQWFRLVLRFSLAPVMMHYGILKILPTQMFSPPPLGVQAMRVGELTPMQMLWTFMGTSTTYESLTGVAELTGGVLLLLPRTTLLGAMISLADMLMVFTMNMCFDVHVKAWSLHLLVMSALLVAPDLPRLADVFLFNRTAPARIESPLFRRRWLALLPHALILLYGLFCLGKYSLELKQRYTKMYPPRPPLYGLWSVTELTVDGSTAASLADPQRWHYLTFRTPGKVTVESASGTKATYPLRVDPAAHTLTVGPAAGPQGRFTFSHPDPNVVTLDGVWNGHATHTRLTSMPLVSQPFRWIYVFGPEE
jgi:uncharacterized membrane protein YphA (DoxX/SURF4 family)